MDEPINLRNITKKLGGHQVLNRLDFALSRGEIVALLGRNGAGKSTMVNIALGLLSPDQGEAILFGTAPGSLAVRRRLGVMLQAISYPPVLKIGELLRLFCSYYAAPIPLATLAELTGIEPLLRHAYGKLSGGQQRLVQFAAAICGRPQFLILDEPTSGMDPTVRARFWQLVTSEAARGCAVLFTTHILEDIADIAARVDVLSDGCIAQSHSMPELKRRAAVSTLDCVTSISHQTIADWPEVIDLGIAPDGRTRIVSDQVEAIVRHLIIDGAALTGLEIRAGTVTNLLESMVGSDAA